MGKAEKIVKDDEQLTAEEIAAKAAEAENNDDAQESEEVDEAEKLRLKEEADEEKRAELEAEGKTEEEIEAALKSDGEDEVIITREGTQPQKFTQQQVDDIVHKRIKRLNNKVEDATSTTSQTNAELELEREKNKLLALALEQAKENKQVQEVKRPDPNDFDDGVLDPEYIKQNDAYIDNMVQKQVEQRVAKATENVSKQNSQEEQSQALLKKQVKHYERAEEIGAKDYEQTEDVALKALGNEVANHIIDNFDDSHVILYYLGKNPDEAARIAKLIETRPIKGVAEVGRLSAELKIKPKQKDITPNPDEEIKGDGNSQESAIQRRLDKLRDQAVKTGDMKPLMAFKKKHGV